MKTIELVLVGHPDKVCDGIAEEIKKQNPDGRNAIEVCWFNNKIIVGGETNKGWRFEDLRLTIREYLLDIIGLTFEEWNRIEVVNCLNTQSHEINSIVGTKGAGDNGIFFGGWDTCYSPVIYALKRICMALDRKTLRAMGYRTDGKLIADIEDDGSISRLILNIASFATAVSNPVQLACQILALAKQFGLTMKGVEINPRGDWHKCFGFADSGLTGRKLACDTQCGIFHNGGGAWFGKDFSKADFSVPVYLTLIAKKTCEDNGIDRLELRASTIIGDEEVVIENCHDNDPTTVTFAHVMEFARKQKIDILGGIDFGGAE